MEVTVGEEDSTAAVASADFMEGRRRVSWGWRFLRRRLLWLRRRTLLRRIAWRRLLRRSRPLWLGRPRLRLGRETSGTRLRMGLGIWLRVAVLGLGMGYPHGYGYSPWYYAPYPYDSYPYYGSSGYPADYPDPDNGNDDPLPADPSGRPRPQANQNGPARSWRPPVPEGAAYGNSNSPGRCTACAGSFR